MARGWESKSVADQQADREARISPGALISLDEAVAAARIRTLELSRARVQAELATATQPAHRAMLDSALAALDDQIRKQK